MKPIERAQAAAVQAAGEHNLLNRSREIALKAGLLGQIADFVLLQAIAEGKLAGNRRMQPQNRFHERAFSRAVFADDAQVLAPRHGKGDVLRKRSGS